MLAPLSQLPDWVLKLTICSTDNILADVNVWLMLFVCEISVYNADYVFVNEDRIYFVERVP